MGRTHAFDGRPWTDALGLRGAWTAQRNAAGKPFCAFAILRRTESQWFADPWQTPLVACDEPVFGTFQTTSKRSTCGVRRVVNDNSKSIGLCELDESGLVTLVTQLAVLCQQWGIDAGHGIIDGLAHAGFSFFLAPGG